LQITPKFKSGFELTIALPLDAQMAESGNRARGNFHSGKPMKRFLRVSAAAALSSVLVFAVAMPAGAATQGVVGSTSTGSVAITATVPNLVRISSLDDIALGTWSGSGDMTGSDNACVWSTTRKYQITATGSGTAGAFTLTNGGATPSTIAYSVQWAGTSGAGSGSAMTSGTALTGQTTSTTSTTCGGSTNSTLLIRVLDADLSSAPAATYTGTLTLVVAPE
jgi:hypothetical protein